MASGLPMNNKGFSVHQLCEMFPTLQRDVIESVFESCNFNVQHAYHLLCDMTENPKPMITTPAHYSPYNSSGQSSFLQYDRFSSVLAFIRDGYKILILMRGLPGSGKSTLANLLLREGLGQVFHDEFIFSTDDYFKKSGRYIYNPAELEMAHAWNQRRCFSNMRKAVSPIIIDNTNLQLWEMKVYCVMAVQYGYIVEIVEARTSWALDPKSLALKNSHGVDKKKISEMKERYQQNLTVGVLFKEFNLGYTVAMPQKRKYPSLPPPQPVAMSTDVVDKPKNKETKIPVEYVHKFKTRRDDSPDKAKASIDVDQLLDIGNECKQKEPNNKDLISFLNEHKEMAAPDDSSLMKPTAVEQFSKQMEENKMLMSQMMQLLLNAKQEGNGGSVTITESKMEVDQDASSQPENKQTDDIQHSGKGLADLEEENKKLLKMLNSKLVSDKTKANNPFSLLTKTSEETEKKQMEASRLEMYFKHVKAAKSGESSSDFEFIESPDLQSSTSLTKLSSKNEKPEKSPVPKLDLKAWGLPENAQVSWDAITSPVYEFKPADTSTTYVETSEQATNTTSEDFENSRDSTNKINSKKSPELGSPFIKETNRLGNYSLRKKVMLDKGCMTDEELLRGLQVDEAAQVRKLMELFPGAPLDNLLDVYEKCRKDFHWTVELISSTPMMCPPSSGSKTNQKKRESEDVAGPTSPLPPSFTFELNDWNVVPEQSDNIPEIAKEASRKKQDEKEETKQQQKKQDEEEEAKQQQKKQEVLELKKQLEQTVTIGKEHYSDHVWQLKTAKMGRPTVESEDPKPGTSDLISMDADMIYISDDSSECSSNHDEDDENSDDDIVELTLGNELVEQLENMFGQLTRGDNFKPVVQVPESLARQLHVLYLESICKQIESQSDYITSQLKEDEEFAMKLQEAERKSASGNNMNEIMDEELAISLYKKDTEQWKNLSPDTLALKLTRQKLYEAFPTIDQKLLDEVLVAHGNNYMQTIQAIMNSTDQAPATPASGGNLMEPPISDSTLNEMKIHSKFVNKVTEEPDGAVKSAREYREEANRHMQKHKELRTLAQNHYGARTYAVSVFYSDLAQKELKKAELANQHAAQCFIRENSLKFQNSDTLDLHFQYADSAITSLDIFIDFQISHLRSANKPFGHYFIITGWGRRSKNGKPVLKPMVIRRLKQRKINHSVVNPGMLRIKVLKNLAMSTDIKSKLPK